MLCPAWGSGWLQQVGEANQVGVGSMDSLIQMPANSAPTIQGPTDRPAIADTSYSPRRQALWRRSLFFGLTVGTALIAALLMHDVLQLIGLSALGITVLVL